jgi:hypothetical protein
MKRDQKPSIPPELRDADELLYRYGQWAQDRYKKQHCASIEHKYRPPVLPGDEPPTPLMADFRAMDVQHALVVVPMQYRRVLQAFYIPQRLPPQALRRQHGIPSKTWEASHQIGLRMFWSIYGLRYMKKTV